MWAFDENVTLRDMDGVEYGRCRMLGWVSVSDDGVKRWHGELMGTGGSFFDFALVQVEKKALFIECEDGATARILPPTVMDAQSTGTRCFFEGIWPPPRPVG